jgi:hypothetical protein
VKIIRGLFGLRKASVREAGAENATVSGYKGPRGRCVTVKNTGDAITAGPGSQANSGIVITGEE